MNRYNIRCPKKCIQVNLLIALLCRSAGCRIIDYMCVKCLCYICYLSSDCTKSDDPPCLSGKLCKRLAKPGKYIVFLVRAILYIIIIIPEFFEQIKEHGKCVLCNDRGGISGCISPFNSPFIQIIFIQIICSGCCYADQLQILSSSDRLLVYRYLIHDDNICICYPLRNFFRL